MKKQRIWFLWIHAGLIAFIPLSFLYLFLVDLFPHQLSGCLMHDLAFLYCPVCGGTRAVRAMLSFDFLTALRCNAAVTLSVPLFAVLDIVSWRRFFKGENPFFKIPVWGWVLFASAIALFFVGRNLLMILFGFDPMGDLGFFWKILFKTPR